MLDSKRGYISDFIKSSNLCLVRAKINKALFDEIVNYREINRIDRPPKPTFIYSLLASPYESLTVDGPPNKDSAAIAILDTGILSNHPLLEKAVGDETAFTLLHSDKIALGKPFDDVGHGTKVAGIALYGDIRKKITDKKFTPSVWILSAKIMYGEANAKGEIEARYDESELLEHQLEKAVRWAVTHKNCKVINISFGTTYQKMFANKRQFALATLIDELAHELDIIFVISMGNHNCYSLGFPDKYPKYLLAESEDAKLINPASSAYAISVGSIAQDYQPSGTASGQLTYSPAQTNFPSPFTCVGPGYNLMIKPEVVEVGGNIIISNNDPAKIEDISGKVIVLNHNWIRDGKLFSVDNGTSFSAPKISHYIGTLFNHFPAYSANLIKTLLIASSEIPSPRPGELSEISFGSNDVNLQKLLNIYGYGKPDINSALYSEINRVLLIADNKIKLDGVHLYYLYLPPDFCKTSGEKQLSVTLVYNPPIRRNRINYMGASIEYHLFRNCTIDEVKAGYKYIKITDEGDEIVPIHLKNKEITMHPGVRTRKRGIHQKGTILYSGKPQLETDKPLILAIICQNKWIHDPDYMQSYSLAVMVKHQASIDLYNKIKERIELEQRIKIKTT